MEEGKENEKHKEWYLLHELLMIWKNKEPEKHPMYQKATDLIPPNESIDYYQGSYHMLATLFPLVEMVLNPDGLFKDNPGVVAEIMQIQLGHIIEIILKKWPEEDIPTVHNTRHLKKK